MHAGLVDLDKLVCMSTFTQHNPHEIPSDLTWHWQAFRRQRAILRHNIHQECGVFWKLFPRRRGRILPVTFFTKKPTWKEPEPVEGLGFKDCLGLTLRWRVSSTMPAGNGGKRLRRIWVEDRPGEVKNCPSEGVLYAGKITELEDVENYKERWKSINGAFGHYNALSGWFDELVKTRSACPVPEYQEWSEWSGEGVGNGHRAADDKSAKPLGMVE